MINVKDRLPKKRGKYLCIVDGLNKRPDIHILYYANDLYSVDEYDFFDQKGKRGFYDYDGEYGYYEVEVSYWMPLPKMPKGDKK